MPEGKNGQNEAKPGNAPKDDPWQTSQGKSRNEERTMVADNTVPGAGMGTAEGENVKYTPKNVFVEINGKYYLGFEESKKTFDSYGAVVREEIQFEAVETGILLSEKNGGNFETKQLNPNRHKVTASIKVNGVGGLEGLKPEAVESIQSGLRNAFTAANTEGRSHVDFTINNDGSDLGYQGSVAATTTVEEIKLAGTVSSENGNIDQVIRPTEALRLIVNGGKWYAAVKWDEFKESVVTGWNNPGDVAKDVVHDAISFGKGFVQAPIEMVQEG